MFYVTLEDRGFRVQVIAHSITAEGQELFTITARYPRFIHSEVMTHRDFSRNAASSRAIPVQKIINQVRDDPAMPIFWGKNQSGMQAAVELDWNDRWLARQRWLEARMDAIRHAEQMMRFGLHKQIANRILEPWMWMTTIITATNWNNFFKLRRAKDAQPEFKVLANLIWRAKKLSKPRRLGTGDWHLPFVTDEELNGGYGMATLLKMSVARCARVSYLNHDGTASSLDNDVDLHDRLIQAPHASPFEHQAQVQLGRHANFVGYKQYRSMIPNEYHLTYDGEPEDAVEFDPSHGR